MPKKNTYQHVESKVKKYISNIKQEENDRKKRRNAKQLNNDVSKVKNEPDEKTNGSCESYVSESIHKELLFKYHKVLEENGNLRAELEFFHKNAFREPVQISNTISLLSITDYPNSMCSSVCTNDFLNVTSVNYKHSQHEEERRKQKSLIITFTKKMLQKFSCSKNDEKKDVSIKLQSMQKLRRFNTPKHLINKRLNYQSVHTPERNFNTGLAKQNVSTPRAPIQYGKKNVLFANEVEEVSFFNATNDVNMEVERNCIQLNVEIE